MIARDPLRWLALVPIARTPAIDVAEEQRDAAEARLGACASEEQMETAARHFVDADIAAADAWRYAVAEQVPAAAKELAAFMAERLVLASISAELRP